MKAATVLAAFAGLLAGIGLVAYYGFGAVWQALAAVGWDGFAAVVAFHLGLGVLLGLAWRVIVPSTIVPPPSVPSQSAKGSGVFIWGRLVRDSASEVLPLSQVGGFVIGARAVTVAGIPASLAFASTVVDVTLEVVAQIAYTALGVVLFVLQKPQSGSVYPVVLGLVVAAAAITGFILVQHHGLTLAEGLAKRSAFRFLPKAVALGAPVQTAIHDIYGHRRGIVLGCLLHLGAWIASAVEAWMALHFMGITIGLGPVLAIESLLYAARSVAFAVPNAVGVQEGAYVVLGGLFGLGPEVMLALSLLKRARDLVIGVPTLLGWQALEGGHLLRRTGSN